MSYFSDSIVLANKSALESLAADKLVDRMFYAVTDIGNSGASVWYQYQADNTDTPEAAEHYIVNATNGTGNFLLMNTDPLVTENAGSPDGSVNAVIIGQRVLDTTNGYLWIQNITGTVWTYAVELVYGDGGGGS